METFGLEQSSSYTSRFERMKGMDHGPNHQEGDPAVHTMLTELALEEFLQMATHGISENDQITLRFAMATHDITKADTQKFGVISGKQNELVCATQEQIAQAHELVRSILKNLVSKSDDEWATLSSSAYKKELELHDKEIQARLKELEQKGILAEYPAIVANFRGHDKKSAELIPTIAEESKGHGVDLSEDQLADAEFLVGHHMDLYDFDKFNLNKFKELFVSNGKIDERRISLLRVHSYADDAGKVNNKKKSEPFLNTLDARIDTLRKEYQAELDKEHVKQRAEAFESAIFDGSKASNYLLSRGVPNGREMGIAMKKVKDIIARMQKQNSNVTAQEVREEIETCDLRHS